MTIKSFVGGHPVCIYADCVFDPSIRKYRGGRKIAEIPYSGRMLSAVVSQSNAEPLDFNGVPVPSKTPQIFESADPIPTEEECDLCIVSAMYVAACKSLGVDTSRLLTIGAPVVDSQNRIVGTCFLNKN